MPIVVESSAAVGVSYIIDSTDEDASNVPLELVDNLQRFLIGEDLPAPPEKLQWASSVDTEGSLRAGEARHENRTATITIRLHSASESDLQTTIQEVSAKVEKLRQEGGTLERTLPSGDTAVLDIQAGSVQPAWDRRFIAHWRIDLALTFTAKPYWRTAWRQLSDHTETTSPCIVFTETDIKGDVPALGRLVIDNDATSDQRFAMWAPQSRYYDSATTARLFIEAETLTPLGRAAAHTGATGASGATTNKTIYQSSLPAAYESVLSTQTAGGGAHLSHVGDFAVWARVWFSATSGTISLAFDWALGDFRNPTRNTPVAHEVTTSGWRLVPLGLVHLSRLSGTHRWEGRIVAKSSVGAGDSIHVDYLLLMPVAEGYGEERSIDRFESPATFTARDDFDTGTNLAGSVAATGGTWAGTGGSTVDYSITGAVAQRTNAAVTRRLNSLPVSLSNVLVQGEFAFSATPVSTIAGGVLARYVNDSNHAIAQVAVGDSVTFDTFQVLAYNGAVLSQLASVTLPTKLEVDTYYSIRMQVEADGRWRAWLWETGGTPGDPIAYGEYAQFEAAGGLAFGGVGITDVGPSSGTVARRFNNFFASVPERDAVIYASQSLEVRYDKVEREDSAGTTLSRVSSHRGDYLLIPPSGSEGRTVRIVAKASRNDPDDFVLTDNAIDDISARLWVAERFVHAPGG